MSVILRISVYLISLLTPHTLPSYISSGFTALHQSIRFIGKPILGGSLVCRHLELNTAVVIVALIRPTLHARKLALGPFFTEPISHLPQPIHFQANNFVAATSLLHKISIAHKICPKFRFILFDTSTSIPKRKRNEKLKPAQ